MNTTATAKSGMKITVMNRKQLKKSYPATSMSYRARAKFFLAYDGGVAPFETYQNMFIMLDWLVKNK